ncbi:MAG: hypothetical protein Q8O93_00615 [bacterium]|nr:hypothetical protein [bacterium]
MKKKILITTITISALLLSTAAFAAKPADNHAGAQKVAWNLSAAVMPAPPYGSLDLPGSDTASKLIVNQSNGKAQAMLIGMMNNLNPDTTYTVYLSNGYEKHSPLNLVGSYRWLILGTYEHDLIITEQNPDGTFTGTGGYPAGASTYLTTETITGQITGNQISFTATYLGPYNPGYTASVSGTIAPDGTMSGSSPWEWHTTSGQAAMASGSTGWPGMFDGLAPLTFTTDETGSGDWHANLKDLDLPAGDYNLSVWINETGLTMLISDPFSITLN